jgi:hypothetical protein
VALWPFLLFYFSCIHYSFFIPLDLSPKFEPSTFIIESGASDHGQQQKKQRREEERPLREAVGSSRVTLQSSMMEDGIEGGSTRLSTKT